MEKGWKEIYATSVEYKAEMAKDLLEQSNIKAVILNQHDSAYQVFGEFRLFVSEENLDQANEVLKSLKGE